MKKGLKVILWIYGIFMLADLTTTLMLNKYIIYLESNPIYLIFKSLIPIIILNILYFAVIYFFYNRSTPEKRFFLINVITWLSLARIFAIYNAIMVYITQPAIEQVENISTATKTTNYGFLMFFIFLLPILITQIVLWLFKIDHKIEEKK
jgi:hypothetical protein